MEQRQEEMEAAKKVWAKVKSRVTRERIGR